MIVAILNSNLKKFYTYYILVVYIFIHRIVDQRRNQIRHFHLFFCFFFGFGLHVRGKYPSKRGIEPAGGPLHCRLHLRDIGGRRTSSHLIFISNNRIEICITGLCTTVSSCVKAQRHFQRFRRERRKGRDPMRTNGKTEKR